MLQRQGQKRSYIKKSGNNNPIPFQFKVNIETPKPNENTYFSTGNVWTDEQINPIKRSSLVEEKKTQNAQQEITLEEKSIDINQTIDSVPFSTSRTIAQPSSTQSVTQPSIDKVNISPVSKEVITELKSNTQNGKVTNDISKETQKISEIDSTQSIQPTQPTKKDWSAVDADEVMDFDDLESFLKGTSIDIKEVKDKIASESIKINDKSIEIEFSIKNETKPNEIISINESQSQNGTKKSSTENEYNINNKESTSELLKIDNALITNDNIQTNLNTNLILTNETKIIDEHIIKDQKSEIISEEYSRSNIQQRRPSIHKQSRDQSQTNWQPRQNIPNSQRQVQDRNRKTNQRYYDVQREHQISNQKDSYRQYQNRNNQSNRKTYNTHGQNREDENSFQTRNRSSSFKDSIVEDTNTIVREPESNNDKSNRSVEGVIQQEKIMEELAEKKRQERDKEEQEREQEQMRLSAEKLAKIEDEDKRKKGENKRKIEEQTKTQPISNNNEKLSGGRHKHQDKKFNFEDKYKKNYEKPERAFENKVKPNLIKRKDFKAQHDNKNDYKNDDKNDDKIELKKIENPKFHDIHPKTETDKISSNQQSTFTQKTNKVVEGIIEKISINKNNNASTIVEIDEHQHSKPQFGGKRGGYRGKGNYRGRGRNHNSHQSEKTDNIISKNIES